MTTFTTEELHRDTERVLATTVREGYTLVAAADGSRFQIRMLPADAGTVEPRKVPLHIGEAAEAGHAAGAKGD